jgi:hypothetical protein
MKISKINLSWITAACLSLSIVSHADAERYMPADFAFDAEDVSKRVEKSWVSDSGDVLYCRADVMTSGSAENATCFSKTSQESLKVTTQQAISALEFSPAEVDGKKVPVRMSFRVAFTPLDEGLHVTLVPNLGTMQERYGRDYVAPQERLDVSDWYARYSENSWLGGNAFLGEGMVTRVSSRVSVGGRPQAIRVADTLRGLERDASIVTRTLHHSRFIPGMVDGKVVPMDYMIAVHYDESSQAYVKAR